MAELLGGEEVVEGDALVHLVVEADLVQLLLQLETAQLVENERFLWQQVEVLLEGLTDEVALQALEERALRRLRLQHREHAPGDAHHREVLRLVQVVFAGPLQDHAHLVDVLLIFVALLRVAWDVDAVDAVEFLDEAPLVEGVVDGDDSGARSLQEVRVRRLKEALVVAERQRAAPLVRQRLGQHAEDWLVGPGAHVMAGVRQHCLAPVTAKVVSSVAFCAQTNRNQMLVQVMSCGYDRLESLLCFFASACVSLGCDDELIGLDIALYS